MATPNSIVDDQGQCRFCSDEAKYYCRTCKDNLCLKCHEVHRKSTKANTNHHHLVLYHQRKESLRSAAPDACAVHPGSKYEFGCMNCNVAICKKCTSTLHSGHKKCDMTTFLDNVVPFLREEFTYIQNVIPRYGEYLSRLDETPPAYTLAITEMKQRITQETNQVFDYLNYLVYERHQAVDDVVTLDQEMVRMEKERNQTQHMRLVQLEQRYREFFASIDKNVTIDFLNDRQDFKDLIREPGNNHILPPLYQPSNFNSDILRANMPYVMSTNQSALVETRLRHFDKMLMAEPLRVASFIVGKSSLLYQIKCLGRDGAWILTGESTLSRYNRLGKKLEFVETSDGQNGNPAGIAVTDKSIYYTRTSPNCVCVISQGKKPESVIFTEDWVPNGLCVTATWDLVVALQNGVRGKIVKYYREVYLECLTIQNDDTGHAIFAQPWYVTENRVNGDICVSDTQENLLIVVNKQGKLRFRFDAPYRYFQPRDICTNAHGHIIVADPYNNNINIINMDGAFIMNINTRPLDLYVPVAVSTDAEQNLWIGARDTRRVVVIRYIHDS